MSADPHVVRSGASRVSVLPARGALVLGLTVGDIEALYLDPATVDSPTGAVRGGVPLLFPFAGELEGGRLRWTGTEMPRHGFGRRKAWAVTRRAPDRLEMRLGPDEETRAQYPFEFEAVQSVAALPRGLRIELEVANHDRQPLPLAPGWHPYFPCPAGRKGACLRGLVSDRELSDEPVACDVNVPASADRRVEFVLPTVGRVALAFGSALKTLEVWTPPEGDFVCVEPWVGPSNTINTGDRAIVPPGGRLTFWMAIEVG